MADKEASYQLCRYSVDKCRPDTHTWTGRMGLIGYIGTT